MESYMGGNAWVLLVEDDLEIRETLESLIALEGYSIKSAPNGKEALSVLAGSSDNPSLILLDIMMPVMNGYEFREQQLQNPKIADIPTAVISADGNIIEKSARLKVTEFLKKPMDLSALFALLERFCGKPESEAANQA